MTVSEKTKDGLCKNLSKRFVLDDEQWKSINEWKINHQKRHKKPRNVEYRKLQKGEVAFEYLFSDTVLGTVGTVICADCRDKAMKRSLGNAKKYKALCENYDAEFFVGEV